MRHRNCDRSKSWKCGLCRLEPFGNRFKLFIDFGEIDLRKPISPKSAWATEPRLATSGIARLVDNWRPR